MRAGSLLTPAHEDWYPGAYKGWALASGHMSDGASRSKSARSNTADDSTN